MEKNLKKRLIIIAIYASIIIILFWFFYSIIKPEETCSDGIKNQNEEEIDCGGICAKCKKILVQEINIGEKGIVESSIQNKYDFYGLIINPNKIYGSNDFSYRVIFKDENGNVLSEVTGKNFILPSESKYIIENNIESEKKPSQIDFIVEKANWTEFEYYERPELKIINKTINEVSSGIGYVEAKGLLRNESPFDFSVIKINVILRDAENKIVALNSTEMRTVRSNEEREFKAFWPSKFPGSATYVEVQPEVNIYNSDAFAKRYFKKQSF